MKEEFIQAIKNKRKIRATFFSKKDNDYVTRVCAPMDYGPTRRENVSDKTDRFHMWDYEGKTGPHTASPTHDLVDNITVLDETFDPAEFVSWPPNWFIPRDWGDLS